MNWCRLCSVWCRAQNEGMQPEDEDDDDDEDGRDTEGFVTRGNLRFYDGAL